MAILKILALQGFLLSAFEGLAFAAVHDRLAIVPHSWTVVGSPESDQMMTLSIGLQQQNLHDIEPRLYAMSTPGHEDYGKHMSREEVTALLKPTDDTNAAVLTWLKDAGVTKLTSDGEWVRFATTVGQANKLLDANFMYYESEGVKKLRTLQYSIPDSLVQHVDLVTPTTYFGKTAAQAPVLHYSEDQIASRQVSASCSSSITPACLKQLYNVGTYTPSATSGSKIGFGNFLNQTARTADLTSYESRNSIPSQGFTNVLINGGKDDQSTDNNHGEANLDVQNIIGISHPLPVTSYITGGSPPFTPDLSEPTVNENEPYLDYYTYLLSLANSALPQVISNSYGDDERTVPIAYAQRVCNQIAQLGMRGISVLESSGDTGVGSGCRTNDGTNKAQFDAIFPGTCPYITAVGGTQSISPEVAWADGSGGFSNYFAQPSYQSSAVSTYLSSHISASTKAYYTPYTNFSGRGFPDVSAHSVSPSYAIYVNGALTGTGGTSAASPVVAGIIALLNDARLRAGKPALGFLNPFLYSSGVSGFTDITAGKAVGCNGVNGQTGASIPGGGIIKYASWNGTVGWDPVTGLGVPNFGKLMTAAMAV
ncbi:hypothetical protein MMC14_007865 [Varicellaria rhodocarpa]|nr:hypothetical protein [Varicellaria rhodocarpa]